MSYLSHLDDTIDSVIQQAREWADLHNSTKYIKCATMNEEANHPQDQQNPHPTDPYQSASASACSRFNSSMKRCICESDDINGLFPCDHCKDLFHPECFGFKHSQLSCISLFYCNDCLQKSPNLIVTFKKNPFSSYNVADLRHELELRHLPTDGKKNLLMQRLLTTVKIDNTKSTTSTSQSQFSSNTSMDCNEVLDNIQNGFRSRVRILKRIPKASRMQAAKLLTDTLNEVVDSNNLITWSKLLSFSRLCLLQPKRAGKNSPSLATVVNRKISEFNESISADQIFERMKKNAHELRNNSKVKKKPHKKLSVLVSEKISENDVKGAVRIASSNECLACNNEDTVKKLRELHPVASAFHDMPSEDRTLESSPLQVYPESVMKAIMSFPNGSAAGPDGLRPQHLKELMAKWLGEHRTKLLDALSRFCNMLLSGKIPEEICPIFFGANLCALSKSSGGIRPIAVGFTLRRLVGKLCSSSVMEKMGKLLRPQQLGFGTSLGAEAAVHAARRYADEMTENKVFLKIDFKNAFNSVKRDVILKEVIENLPEIYPFVRKTYLKESNLWYCDHIIHSSEGIQQGDPLGPLLFCLAIKDITKNIRSELNLWYLDDGTIAGHNTDVFEDFQMISEQAREIGLTVNHQKCELIVRNLNSATGIPNISHIISETGMKVIEAKDAVLLGSPIGMAAIRPTLQRKLNDFLRLSSTLQSLDAHDALFLLRNCFSIPKLTYILRTAPCFYFHGILKEYDAAIRETLSNILNCQLNETAWNQATLSISKGGIGVRSAVQLSLPTYLSSAHSTVDLCSSLLSQCSLPADYFVMSLSKPIKDWRAITNAELPLNPSSQRAWDKPILKSAFDQLAGSIVSAASKARILAVSSKYAGAWLNACPIPSLGLKLNNSQLRIACALRLGLPLCQQHVCVCGETVDQCGLHGLRCKKSAGRNARHQEANDLIRRALVSSGVPAILEPPGISRQDGKRPDGLTMIPWKGGRSAVWDFTCRDTMSPSYIASSSHVAGKTASEAEDRKLSKYADLTSTYNVIPFCIETMGAWGPSAIKFARQIGARIEEKTGEERSTTFLFQRLSIAVQRGNAISILGTLPKTAGLDEVFNL